MILFQNGNRYIEQKYHKEEAFEHDIFLNHKAFFGKDTILIETKRKIGAGALGNTIPDGFLFDMSDTDNQEFYLVEIELESHDFYRHIFPQITKFFAFFKSGRKQKELIEGLYSIINTDPELKQQFKKYLGEKEIFKFLNDVVDSSQNILLVMDGEKLEMPEIHDTYTDTWGKMVKLMTIKKYESDGQNIYLVNPEFDIIESPPPEKEEENGESPKYSEEFHFERVEDKVKEIYKLIKGKVLEIDPSFMFNIQKYYISLRGTKNIAYLEIRKKMIRCIILLPDEYVRKNIRNHKILSLSEPVQKFYNSPCTSVYVSDRENIDEVIELFKVLMKKK